MTDERLEAALDAGLEETQLPASQMHVRGVRPDVDDLIRRRLLPQELRQALAAAGAAKAAPEPELANDDAADAAAAGLDYLDHAAAAFIEEYRFDVRATWRPVSVSVERFRRMALEDREHLRNFVRRSKEIAALTPFRDEPGRDAAGADGGAVAPQPELVSAARPGRRVRDR